ncbi:MAG: DUF1802 family protein [Phycisphaeraceae bacterium]
MLAIALKEWAVVTELLLEGRLAILLRKGGIHESSGPGIFDLEYERFLLFPSWLHQKPAMIKEEFRDRVQTFGSEPTTLTFHGLGEAAKIWQVPSRAAFDQLDDLHCWTKDQIDMRFGYRPDNPLYLLALRIYRLPAPHTIANTATYGGCRSWVPLSRDDAVDDTAATPVLGNTQFNRIIDRVDAAMTA